MTESEAFQEAVARIGSAPANRRRVSEVGPIDLAPVKVVIGLGVVGAVLASILFVRIDRRASFLLASHVFTVTLGYGSVLLTGMLGICFVCQRCLFDFLRN